VKGSKESVRGRGAADNPVNRFETIRYEAEPAEQSSEGPPTLLFRDNSQSILAHNDSPDVGFSVSINPYRGCEHGCIYCYARPTHEYLGFSAGLDFETKIMVKEDAPQLLRKELSSRRWKPEPIGVSGVTDPYQPIERRFQLTRQCLQVLAEFRNPVMIVTKNHLVTRDVDVLAELAQFQAASVAISITTLDEPLRRKLEPRASHPFGRLAAVEALRSAGIPVGVLVAPIIPGLNDHEIPAIVEAAAQAGAGFAGYIILRLPHGVAALFEEWLSQHFSDRKDKILNRIRDLRGGELNDPRFGSRMKGEGTMAQIIQDLFAVACRQAGIARRGPTLSAAHFRRPQDAQPGLFD
jgi:DNA repair photolyase